MFKGEGTSDPLVWDTVPTNEVHAQHTSPAPVQAMGKVRNMKGGTLSSMRICKVGNQKEILHALLKPFWWIIYSSLWQTRDISLKQSIPLSFIEIASTSNFKPPSLNKHRAKLPWGLYNGFAGSLCRQTPVGTEIWSSSFILNSFACGICMLISLTP